MENTSIQVAIGSKLLRKSETMPQVITFYQTNHAYKASISGGPATVLIFQYYHNNYQNHSILNWQKFIISPNKKNVSLKTVL